MINRLRALYAWYNVCVQTVVMVMAYIAGAAVCVMMVTTCLDVVLRKFGWPLRGALDIVTLSGAVCITCALPYTTAVKGHVSIEYFFHKLSRRGRIIVDTSWRLLAVVLFAFLSRRCVIYGKSMYESGDVTLTLQIPMYWVLYVLAFSCGVVALVIVHNMLHPNREMIKP
ncbi:MAG: TRAP transporter small permease [Candidatus Hydrogenedentota bacterium]